MKTLVGSARDLLTIVGALYVAMAGYCAATADVYPYLFNDKSQIALVKIAIVTWALLLVVKHRRMPLAGP